MRAALRAAATWGRMVRLSHTVFALPFALASAALAAARHGIEVRQVVWILVAMFAARNAAMGFNRLVDQRFDAANPRTADRELPAGRLSRAAVWAFTAGLAALFAFAAFRLNPLCGALSPSRSRSSSATRSRSGSPGPAISCWGSRWRSRRSARGSR